MEFKNFIELGKEIFIIQGPLSGTFGIITDIISTTKILIQQLNDTIKKYEVSLNKVIILNKNINTNKNSKENYDLSYKTNQKNFKDINRNKRNSLNDFERYKVKNLKKSKKLCKKTN